MLGPTILAIATLLLLPDHIYAAASLPGWLMTTKMSPYHISFKSLKEKTWRTYKRLRTGTWDQAQDQVWITLKEFDIISLQRQIQHDMLVGPLLSSAKKVYLRAFLKEVSWVIYSSDEKLVFKWISPDEIFYMDFLRWERSQTWLLLPTGG